MRITKCDICKKIIPSRLECVKLSYSDINTVESFEFCEICGKSITKILKDKKLLKTKDKKNGGAK